MGQAYELPVVDSVFAETACAYAHAVLGLAVELALRTVVLLEVGDELLRCAGKLKLLRKALEILPSLEDLLLRGLLLEVYEHCCGVAVGNGNTDALRRDDRSACLDDLAVLDVAPDAQRLLLALLLLAADVRDDVVDHLRPVLEVLAGAGDCLVRRRDNYRGLELLEGVKHRRVALDGAVGLAGDEAALRAEALLLELDDIIVLGVQFRHNHRNVGRPAMCAVVGYNGRLGLGIRLLDGADLVLLKVYSGKYKVTRCGNLLHLACVVDDQILDRLGHRGRHFPTITHGVLVALAGASGRSGNGHDLKPGVVFQK